MKLDKTFKSEAQRLLAEAKFERSWEDTWLNHTGSVYSAGHIERIERTFKHLQDLPKPLKKVVDLGTASIYHPELSLTFPEAEIHFSGPLTKPNWFSLNLEKDPLPFEDGSVDLVLLLEVIEHFYADPMFCISEINRVLKTGGLLFLTTPNILSARSAVANLLGFAPYFYFKYERAPNAKRHVHEFTPYQIEDTLQAGGFNPSLWTENVYQRDVPELLEALEQLGCSSKDRGDTIFCLATKTGAVVNRYPPMIYS